MGIIINRKLVYLSMEGISFEDFKNQFPELHRIVMQSWEGAEYIDIYGMKIKCRKSGQDYYQIINEIDNRSPHCFYRICEGRFKDSRPCGVYFNWN